MIRAPAGSTTLQINRPLQCVRGNAILPAVTINYTRIGTRGKPLVFIMPSMSHSSHVSRPLSGGQHYLDNSDSQGHKVEQGWWEDVVGNGSMYGIDLQQYEVICASALGGPYGSTSPLTRLPNSPHLYRYEHFPIITPADQAALHAMLKMMIG